MGFVDASFGKSTQTVYDFCEAHEYWMPVFGRGVAQQYNKSYSKPKSTGSIVRLIGDEYHLSETDGGRMIMEINADHWKSHLHERLRTPLANPEKNIAYVPGAMTLYQAIPQDHFALAKHFTAERQIEEFIPGKGRRVRWEVIRRANHYFDCAYMACAAAHYCGVRILTPEAIQERRQREAIMMAGAIAAAEQQEPGFTTPDGRPYLVTER